MSNADPQTIAVIGAGITGITTAYNLARRGYRVTVFDRHPYAAMETSFANGGQLSASNAEVWNSWGTVLKGMKWMLSAGRAAAGQPEAILAQAVLDGRVHRCHPPLRGKHHHHRPPRDRGARSTCAAWPRRRASTSTARTAASCISTKRRRISMPPPRSPHCWPKADWNAAPSHPRKSARSSRRCAAPIMAASTRRQISPATSTNSPTDSPRACERHGVTMRYATEVISAAASADRSASPAGRPSPSWTACRTRTRGRPSTRWWYAAASCRAQLSQGLGDRVNVYPVKGYSITVSLPEVADQQAAPWMSLLDDRTKIVTSRLGPTRFRVAGTAEFNGYNRDIRADRIAPLVAWCRAHFPGMSTRQSVPWAGLRPMMPDMLPRVVRGRNPSACSTTPGMAISAGRCPLRPLMLWGHLSTLAPTPERPYTACAACQFRSGRAKLSAIMDFASTRTEIVTR